MMAEMSKSKEKQNVFWTNLDMESSEEDAYIPGLSAPGNKRPSRVKARRTKEVKAKIPVSQPVVEDIMSSPDDDLVAKQQRLSKAKHPKRKQEKSKQNAGNLSCDSDRSDMVSASVESFMERSIRRLNHATASLKDLRPEDKQRVANLIKELARVGEEKEKVVQELHGEREHHEKQILTLVEQQEKILSEREEIQNKLFQCQQLLTEYQGQLLNKQDQLSTSIASIKEVQRQSRSRESGQGHKERGRLYEDQMEGDSVSDLFLQNKNPEDNIKRPFTSLIDKEIAKERSLSRSSRGSGNSRSRSVSPLDGRPRFSYPPKLNGIGPLTEPVASSTHKSMDIKQNLPEHDLESPRSSLRGSSVRGQSPDGRRQQPPGKVVFSEETEESDNAKLHSPNMKNPKMFNDPDYAKYYKKLSPTGRKRELLKQRQSLLDEQERLRVILEKQEKALKLRQYEYQKREELQRERMEFYKEGGKFPALRLDFDGEGQSETEVNVNIENGLNDKIADIEGLQVKDRHIEAMDVGVSGLEDVEIDDEVQIRRRVSAGTSPIGTPRAQKVSMATSPAPPEEDFTTPRLVDAATSISYRTPLKDTSNRQGNLPLQSNRQKTSPLPKQPMTSPFTKQPITSPYNIRQPVIIQNEASMSRTPGEKTLNVLELVNSMEERPPSLNNSLNQQDRENKPVGFSSMKQLQSAGKYSSPRGSQSTPHRKHESSQAQGTRQGKDQMEKKVASEENQILEDIFFLK